MLLLPHGAVKRLVETGRVEAWSPQLTVQICDRCGCRLKEAKPRCPRCSLVTEGEPAIPKPALNIHHVVRKRSAGETVARAQGIDIRGAVLQDLTPIEAASAGFRTRDDFYTWWRLRYGTGPLLDPIACWVTTYEYIALVASHYLARPIPGHRGDYTGNSRQMIDDHDDTHGAVEAVDAEAWVEKNNEKRALETEQAKLLARMRRRQRRAA